jgi:hypothetical protein
MPPNSSSRHIHPWEYPIESPWYPMGLNMEACYQGSQVIMGLVMAECAKPNEYND